MVFYPSVQPGEGGEAPGGALLNVNNLADVLNADISRTNIGAGIGDMIGANNLSEVTDPAAARANLEIDQVGGLGDMLGANNLSEITNPAIARQNIGAGIGDMLGANNLSEVGDKITAKQNINAHYYGVDESLGFGGDILNPQMQLKMATDNHGNVLSTIQWEKDLVTQRSHLYLGASDSIFELFSPTFNPANQFEEFPGVIIPSDTDNNLFGFFPGVTATMGIMVTPYNFRLQGSGQGNSTFFQIGSGGGSQSLVFNSGAGSNSTLSFRNSTFGYIRSTNRDIEFSEGSTLKPMAFHGTLRKRQIVIVDEDYEVQPGDHIMTYIQLTQAHTILLPKISQSESDENSVVEYIIRDATGLLGQNIGNGLIELHVSANGPQINGNNTVVLDKPYQSISFIVEPITNNYIMHTNL